MEKLSLTRENVVSKHRKCKEGGVVRSRKEKLRNTGSKRCEEVMGEVIQ